MNAMIRAELLKLRTVRSSWALLLVLPPVAVITLLDAALDPVDHNSSVVDFMDVSLTVVAIGLAAFAAALVATEFSRRTVGLDYLAVPRRTPVMSAKFIAYAWVGAVLGLLAVLIAHAVAVPIAIGRDVTADGPGAALLRVTAVTVVIAALGATGAALGVLVPQPAVAAGVVIGWQFVEGLLGMALGISQYLPIGLLTTVAHLGGTVPLPVALALLFLYTAGMASAALLVAKRQDLTG